MNLYNTVSSIEGFIQDNKGTLSPTGGDISIHYSGTEFIPEVPEWVSIIVQPVDGGNQSFDCCLGTTGIVILTCYGANKADSAKISDNVITLFRNTTVPGDPDTEFKGYRTLLQGNLENGTFYYKFMFEYQALAAG